MPRTLTPTFETIVNTLLSAQGWLFYVEIPRRAGGYYRLVRNNRHVTADGKVWQASEMKLDLGSLRADGGQSDLVVSIPNISRLPMAALEVENELYGQPITVWFQPAEATSFVGAVSWASRISLVEFDERWMDLVCGSRSPVQVPGPVYDRNRFPQLYGQ